MSVIYLENITKSYGSFSLKPMNFKIEEGEKWGLVAPSGSGKTSLLRCIMGLERVDSGEIHYNQGQEYEEFLEDTGVIWGSSSLPLHMTPLQLERVFSSQYQTWDRDAYHILLNNLDLPRKNPLETREKSRDCLFAAMMARYPSLFIYDQQKERAATREEEETRQGPSLPYSFLKAETQLFCVDSIDSLPEHLTHLAFMREGELLFQGEKDKLLRDCAIVDCAPSQLEGFCPEDYLARRELEGVVELLVEDRFDFFLKYPKFPFKDTTMREVSDLLLQGGTV